MQEFKCGFVGIVGPTNSGKSTLLNALVGEKVSIVSKLPQTTYHALKGILNGSDYQIIFTDTPGFQNYPESVPRLLNRVADRSAEECDLLLWMFDASNPRLLSQVEKLQGKIQKFKSNEFSVAILNKVDLVPKASLLPLLAKLSELKLFSDIIPISAFKEDGIDRVVKVVLSKLPSSHALYEPNQVTDRPVEFRMAEIVREKIYRLTKQEIPYSVYVEVEEEPVVEGRSSRVPNFRAVIHVDSSSRKGILIGKGGELLKSVGSKAREDIEKIVGHQICIKLHVDVENAWREDRNRLQNYLELS